MLASVFIVDGLDALRNPKSRVAAAEPVYAPLVERVPQLSNTEQVVKLDAAVKVVAGTLLAFGRSPRLSALTLAAGLVPTTLAAHRFWNETDPQQRSEQRLHFLKNTSALGGLILAAVDTEGRPSLGWRARRSPHVIKHAASDLRRDSTMALHDATGAVRYAAADLLHNAKPALHNVADRLQS
jgi:putative oxidoreductase